MSKDCYPKVYKNCWIAKGDGTPLEKKSIVIDNGKIVAIEKDIIPIYSTVIDLKNRYIVAPGFIDVHGHSDISVLADSTAFSKISQGVTTEIVGNCGLSAFPISSENFEHLTKLYSNYGVDITWKSFSDYQQHLKNNASVLNIKTLVGHNTLRACVSGYDKISLSYAQLEKAKALLDEALSNGALGLSFGLLYTPGINASDGEIIELCKVVAKHDKIVTVHLKSEGDKLIESLSEMIYFAKLAQLKKLHISHFKTAGKENFQKLDEALDIMQNAASFGVTVTFDRYPYIESLTQLSISLPDKYLTVTDREITQKLQNSETRRLMLEELRSFRDHNYWKNVRLAATSCPKYQMYQGMKISDFSSDCALDVIEILGYNSNTALAAFSGMSYDNMLRIITNPFCMAGSDGNALPLDLKFGGCHPRAFGAIPHFIKLLLEEGVPIEKAIFKCTGLAAKTFNLTDCGLLNVGARADMVIFDPDEIDGCNNYASPNTPASGIIEVLSNGNRVL